MVVPWRFFDKTGRAIWSQSEDQFTSTLDHKKWPKYVRKIKVKFQAKINIYAMKLVAWWYIQRKQDQQLLYTQTQHIHVLCASLSIKYYYCSTFIYYNSNLNSILSDFFLGLFGSTASIRPNDYYSTLSIGWILVSPKVYI